jgi:hypothetical protein
MLTKKNYDELYKRTELYLVFYNFKKDKDIALDKIIEFVILNYIQSSPEYTAERIFSTLGANINTITNKIYEKVKRAYPDANFYKLKKIDVNKLFYDSEEQQNSK